MQELMNDPQFLYGMRWGMGFYMSGVLVLAILVGIIGLVNSISNFFKTLFQEK